MRPRLHIFGHVHYGFGRESAYFDDLQLAYERFLSRPPQKLIWEIVPNRSWLDVAHIMFLGVETVLWKWLMGGPGSNQGSVLVNAAQMHGSSGKVRSRAVVIDM